MAENALPAILILILGTSNLSEGSSSRGCRRLTGGIIGSGIFSLTLAFP